MKSAQRELQRHQNNLFIVTFKKYFTLVLEDWNDGTGATYVYSSD